MSEYLPPFLSLDVPIKPPGPDEGPVCFQFDAKWIPYILAVLKTLTLDGVYASDQDAAKGAASELLEIFMGAGICSPTTDLNGLGSEDCMGCCIRMRNGILQVLQCGEWVPVDGWDINAVTGNQPGAGSPQPAPGACQTFQGKITPVESWLLPVPVSAGDQITVTNLFGTWSPSAFTGIWICPDGNLYFAGNCIEGTGSIDTGAPDPTAALNGTVMWDGTNYYDVSNAANVDTPVVVTILPGIVNKQLIVRCNFHGGVEPSGEVTFSIEVCKAVPTNWTHTFDFVTNASGFVPLSLGAGTAGVWSAGVGWVESDEGPDGPTYSRACYISLTGFTPTATIDSMSVQYDFALGGDDFGSQEGLELFVEVSGALTNYYSDFIGTVPTGTNKTAAGTLTIPLVDTLRLYMRTDARSSGGARNGSGRFISLTVTGHGPNPF